MGLEGSGRLAGVENNGTTTSDLGKGQSAEILESARNNIALGQSCTAVTGSQVFDEARHMGIENSGTTTSDLGKGQSAASLQATRSNIALGQSCTAVLGSHVFDEARHMGIEHTQTTNSDVGGFYQKRRVVKGP